MSRLSTLNPTRRRQVLAAISSFMNLIMIYVSLGMELAGRLLAKRHLQPRLGRQPLDTYLVRHYDRQRHLRNTTKISDTYTFDQIRMNRGLFRRFCEVLTVQGGLKKTRNVDIDEMVYTFLRTISHNEKNRTLQVNLRRSWETISRSIHRVLKAVIRLNSQFMKKPVPIPTNETSSRWKHFKRCLGALDGTHIDVRPLTEDKPRYRDRKGHLTMNVLGVCTPNLEFVYCLAGWEGSAHDSRVLRDALTRPNGLNVPQGNYYLCDAGYANCPGFLAPYRGQRYHLKEWGTRQPETANGRATGLGGFSGNDPEIISEGDDSGSEDDEGPPVPLAEMVNPAVEEEMFNIINEGVEDKNVNKKKRPANTPMSAPLEKKKKKVQGAVSDDTNAELGCEMKLLRPLIQQSVDTIAKAMGESEEHDNMRKELRGNLDKLEGLTRVQRVLAVRILNANPTDLKSFYEMDDEDKLTLILSLI